MKNIDKIAHMDNMIANLKSQIEFSEKSHPNSLKNSTIALVIESWKMDLSALKFARKAIQLWVDLVNEENEGGDYGF
jgi:hypothetical protein